MDCLDFLSSSLVSVVHVFACSSSNSRGYCLYHCCCSKTAAVCVDVREQSAPAREFDAYNDNDDLRPDGGRLGATPFAQPKWISWAVLEGDGGTMPVARITPLPAAAALGSPPPLPQRNVMRLSVNSKSKNNNDEVLLPQAAPHISTTPPHLTSLLSLLPQWVPCPRGMPLLLRPPRPVFLLTSLHTVSPERYFF